MAVVRVMKGGDNDGCGDRVAILKKARVRYRFVSGGSDVDVIFFIISISVCCSCTFILFNVCGDSDVYIGDGGDVPWPTV